MEFLAPKLPERISIDVCKRCGRLLIGDSWVKKTTKNIELAVQKIMKKLDVNVEGIGDRSIDLLVSKPDDNIYGIKKTMVLKEHMITCESCTRKAGGYYEAVVQLRGNMEKAQKILNAMNRFLEKNGGFISKLEEMDNGIDAYISSKRLANEYFSHRKIKPTMSYTLFGLVRGRKVYRNTYALHV